MVTKFSVRQTLDEAQAEGRTTQRVLLGLVGAVVLSGVGVGIGVLLAKDDPIAFVQTAMTNPAPEQVAPEVTRAATSDFTAGLGVAAPAEPEPSAVAAPAQLADLIMMAVQESVEATNEPGTMDPASFAAIETPVVAPTPEPEPEVEIAALSQPSSNAELFSDPTLANEQCFLDLQNLTRDARVYFPAGGTTVDASGIAQARLIGLVAQSCPGVVVQVEGHSDPSGDPAINLALSVQRADVVVDRIAAAGIDTGVFRTVAFGDRVPSNTTGPEASSYYDRRVEFSVVRTNAGATTQADATSVALPACVEQLQTAVAETQVFFRPNSVTVPQTELAAVFQLAATAAACPQGKLRVIGHFAEGEADGETVGTGRMRALAMRSIIVASGFDSEQLIIAAPSSPTLIGPQGINNRRVDFDVIYDPS